MNASSHRALIGGTRFIRLFSAEIPGKCRLYRDLLQFCSNPLHLKQIHAQIITAGLGKDIFLLTKLLRIYVALKTDMVSADMLFRSAETTDGFLFNEIIRGHSCKGNSINALQLFWEMRQKSLRCNSFTYPFVLKACAALDDPQEGRKIHGIVIKSGFGSDVFVGNGLMDMYAKCGILDDASMAFDEMPVKDVVSWNVMISGCVQNGHFQEALTVFFDMWGSGIVGNSVSFKSVLPACAQTRALQLGRWIHNWIVRNGLKTDVILETALVDMYAKCGCLNSARSVFDKMRERSLLSWNVMVAGYAQAGLRSEALALFRKIHEAELVLNSVALLSVIPACSALKHGKAVHAFALRHGLVQHLPVENAIVNMYAKCGSVHDSRLIFDRMLTRDEITWNAMIFAYGQHGLGEEALQLFWDMGKSDVRPGAVTFLGVISACSHAGLEEQGKQCFELMRKKYKIEPTREHYACMVGLYGRYGDFESAQKLIRSMPMLPGSSLWEGFLGACKMHGNAELAEKLAKEIF